MTWQPYTLRFRQSFGDGYRYLDRCGEFILAASRELGFIAGDIKVTGAKLVIPEDGIQAHIDARTLELRQEAPLKEFTVFQALSASLATLAEKHFGPLLLEENLYEECWIAPTSSPEQTLKATLKLPVDPANDMGRALDMVVEQKHFDVTFRSGARRLQLQMQPVTFENVTLQRQNAVIYATRSQVDRARRFTQQGTRVPNYPAHALLLQAVLVEAEPPGLQALEEQFRLLHEKTEIARNKLLLT